LAWVIGTSGLDVRISQYPGVNEANEMSGHLELAFSGNYAAVVGIFFCLLMLAIWFERDTITLKQGKRDWEDE
jgi:hypothetical protein